MQKILFTILSLIVLGNFACQNSFLAQNNGASNAQSSPQNTPTENNFNEKEYNKHFSEGIKNFPNNMSQSLEEFKKAAEINSKDTNAYYWMVKIYLSLKDYEALADCYHRILERDHQDIGAQWGLAQVLVWDLGKYDEGLKEALVARDKDSAPTSYNAEKTIGRAYEGLGDISNAVKHYKIYLKENKAYGARENTEIKEKIAELEKTIKNSKP